MFFLYFAGTDQIPFKAPFFNDSGTVRILLNIILYIIVDFLMKTQEKN